MSACIEFKDKLKEAGVYKVFVYCVKDPVGFTARARRALSVSSRMHMAPSLTPVQWRWSTPARWACGDHRAVQALGVLRQEGLGQGGQREQVRGGSHRRRLPQDHPARRHDQGDYTGLMRSISAKF